MTLITCLHHLLLHSPSHERSISAFVIAGKSLCSYVRVAKGYLCLHCQAGAVRSRDRCHVLMTQHNQENARMSPDPSLRGLGSGHETSGVSSESFWSWLVVVEPAVTSLSNYTVLDPTRNDLRVGCVQTWATANPPCDSRTHW